MPDGIAKGIVHCRIGVEVVTAGKKPGNKIRRKGLEAAKALGGFFRLPEAATAGDDDRSANGGLGLIFERLLAEVFRFLIVAIGEMRQGQGQFRDAEPEIHIPWA